MHNRGWRFQVASMGLALRSVLFEKYSFAVAILWWVVVGLGALLGFLVHWGAGSSFLLLGALLFKRLKALMLRARYRLIRRGDRIEYALPGAEALAEQFATARVLQYLCRENAARTSLFDPELLPFYRHYYLVKTGKNSSIIPYEWVFSIELDEEV